MKQISLNKEENKPFLGKKASRQEGIDVDEYEYLGNGVIRPAISIEDYLLKVLQGGSMTRGELSAVTDIPRTTLYDSLVKLIIQNKVEKFSSNRHKRGRPKVYYRISPEK